MDKKKPGTPQKSFKARMAELVLHSHRSVSDLAKELGVSVAMVEQWKKEFGIEVKPAKPSGAKPQRQSVVQPTKPTKISLMKQKQSVQKVALQTSKGISLVSDSGKKSNKNVKPFPKNVAKPLGKFNPKLRTKAAYRIALASPNVAASTPPTVKIYGPDTLVSTNDSAGLPVKYTAVVDPQGGNYQWSIGIGSNAILIVSPLNQHTVNVQALQHQWSGSIGDQVLYCDYNVNGQDAPTAEFKITVARPARVIKTGEEVTTWGANYVGTKIIYYQLLDQFDRPIKQIVSFTNGVVTISQRVITLLISEHIVCLQGPEPPGGSLIAINLPLTNNSGRFYDDIELSSLFNYTIDQWVWINVIPWANKGQDTGNFVMSNAITYTLGASEIEVTRRS